MENAHLGLVALLTDVFGFLMMRKFAFDGTAELRAGWRAVCLWSVQEDREVDDTARCTHSQTRVVSQAGSESGWTLASVMRSYILHPPSPGPTPDD